MATIKPTFDLVIPIYNGAESLRSQVPGILSWIERSEGRLQVYLVDDGSTDDTSSVLSSLSDTDGITCYRNESNQGRGAALNIGIFSGEGDFVVLLDVDCVPVDEWYSEFSNAAQRGVDLICGNLVSKGDCFWAQYANRVYAGRAQNFDKEGAVPETTAFCAVRRDLLVQSKGYYEEYQAYGFEDKDLIERLIQYSKPTVCFIKSVKAVHESNDTLERLTSKIYNAGRYTAPIFSRRFPESYKRSQYWWFDCDEHNFLYSSILLLWAYCVRTLVPYLEWILERSAIPFWVRRRIAQMAIAASFCLGTFHRKP